VKLGYLFPAFLWFFIILLVVSIPGSNIPESEIFKIPHFDKLVHFSLFFVFTILLNYGFQKQNNNSALKRYNYTIAVVSGVIYSVITEVIQYYFIAGRSGEYLDFVANITGIVSGVLFFRFFLKTAWAAKLSL
jgi:VanZ family protein